MQHRAPKVVELDYVIQCKPSTPSLNHLRTEKGAKDLTAQGSNFGASWYTL